MLCRRGARRHGMKKTILQSVKAVYVIRLIKLGGKSCKKSSFQSTLGYKDRNEWAVRLICTKKQVAEPFPAVHQINGMVYRRTLLIERCCDKWLHTAFRLLDWKINLLFALSAVSEVVQQLGNRSLHTDFASIGSEANNRRLSSLPNCLFFSFLR